MKTQSIQYAIALSKFRIMNRALAERPNDEKVVSQITNLRDSALSQVEVTEKEFLKLSPEERAHEAIKIAECLYIPFVSVEALLNRKGGYRLIYWPGGADCFEALFGKFVRNQVLHASRIQGSDAFELFVSGEFLSKVKVNDSLGVR